MIINQRRGRSIICLDPRRLRVDHIAHDMAQFHIDNIGKDVSVTDFLQQASKKFEGSNFRKLLEAVEKCFGR